MDLLTAIIPLSNVVEAEPPRERETMDGLPEASVSGFSFVIHQGFKEIHEPTASITHSKPARISEM